MMAPNLTINDSPRPVKTREELLDDLNKIICHEENGYLWRELSEFDMDLRNYFVNEMKGKTK